MFRDNCSHTFDANGELEESSPYEKMKIHYQDSDFCNDAQNVTIDFSEDWNNESHDKIFIPNTIYGWETFDGMDFLRNGKLVFNLDNDSFLRTCVYPTDALTSMVHPDVVLFCIKRYENLYGREQLEYRFPVLSLFHRTVLGQNLLQFFYDEKKNSSKTALELIKKIHKLYHETPNECSYKPYLFYLNNSVTSISTSSSSPIRFNISRYILCFISFHLMFICPSFIESRIKKIFRGLDNSSKNGYLKEFFSCENDMNVQLSILNTIFIERKGSRDLGEKFSEKLSWISKKHVKLQINGVYPFFSFLYTHWSSNIIRRNVTLWDERIIVYNDTPDRVW